MNPSISRTLRTFAALLALALLPALPAAGAKAETEAIAAERLGPTSLALDAQIAYEVAELRIVGPGGYEVRKRFGGGTPIFADLLADRAPAPTGQQGEGKRAESSVLDDGRYHYEAVLVDAAGQSKLVTGLFYVEGGVAISLDAMRARLADIRSELRDSERAAGGSEVQKVTGEGLTNITAPALVSDDVFVADTAADGHTFLTLQSLNNPPDDSDWQFSNAQGVLQFNEFAPGLLTRATMLPGGNLGLGTAAPAVPLHVHASSAINAQVRISSPPFIFDPATKMDLWEGGDGLRFIDDNGDHIVRFSHAAPGDRLVVTGTGVGIDTVFPGANLHIFGAANADVFSAVGPDPGPGGNALNFGYSGATFGVGSGFFNVRPEGAAPNPALYFATGDVDRMLIDNQGFLGVHLDGALGPGFNPAHPIHSQTSGAHLTAGGIWTNASSRELKEGITPLGAEAALQALAKLEPVSFTYKVEPEDPHVGFIAEEVPELVASPDRRTLSPLDIVAVLTRVVKEQQAAIDGLLARMEELEKASP